MFENVPVKSNKKILVKPWNVLNQLEIYFSRLDKLNTLSDSTHPYIYNFFSFHDSLLYIGKDRHGTYSLRGYVPKGFHLPYPDVLIHRPMCDVYYMNKDLRAVTVEFEKFVNELLKYYYFRRDQYFELNHVLCKSFPCS